MVLDRFISWVSISGFRLTQRIVFLMYENSFFSYLYRYYQASKIQEPYNLEQDSQPPCRSPYELNYEPPAPEAVHTTQLNICSFGKRCSNWALQVYKM